MKTAALNERHTRQEAEIHKLVEDYGLKSVGAAIRDCMRHRLDQITAAPDEFFGQFDIDAINPYQEELEAAFESGHGERPIEFKVYQWAVDALPSEAWAAGFYRTGKDRKWVKILFMEVPDDFLHCVVKQVVGEGMAKKRAILQRKFPPGVARALSSRVVLQDERNRLCKVIEDGQMPPLRLLVLADNLDVDYTEDTPWEVLCERVSDAVLEYTR